MKKKMKITNKREGLTNTVRFWGSEYFWKYSIGDATVCNQRISSKMVSREVFFYNPYPHDFVWYASI